jgi:hypothetical protein
MVNRVGMQLAMAGAAGAITGRGSAMNNHTVSIWLRLAGDGGAQGMVVAVIVAALVLLSFLLLYRVRSRRRWKALLDAYANRQIGLSIDRRSPVPVSR